MDRWRNVFLGVLSHDLRGPLNAILLDVEVAALTCEMLAHLGFSVIHAASAEAALGALANSRSIDVVFSDVMLPGGMSGLELAREITRRQPGLPIVLTTDCSEASASR